MFLKYLDKLKYLSVEDLLFNFKTCLNLFKIYKKDINSHFYYKMEAIIQLLNVKYLNEEEKKDFNEFIHQLDNITPKKCRCELFNSYEIVGTEIFNQLNFTEKSNIHIYGQCVKRIFKKWKKEKPIMHFENFLKKNITEEIIEDVKAKKENVIYYSLHEAKKYIVDFEQGSIYWKSKDNTIEFTPRRYMFVLDLECKNLYVGRKKKGTLQHTSFLQGAPVACAGFITIDSNKKITLIRGHSGHYKPKMEHLLLFKNFLIAKIGQEAEKIEISAYENKISS